MRLNKLLFLFMMLFPFCVKAEVVLINEMRPGVMLPSAEREHGTAGWFLLEAAKVAEGNLIYAKGRKFRAPLVMVNRQEGNLAEQYLEIVKQAVAENRRNIGNPDYLPHNVNEIIEYAEQELRSQK